MTPADFASCGEVAGDDEAGPGVDVWADIWNRQRNTSPERGMDEVGTRQSGWRVPWRRRESSVERLLMIRRQIPARSLHRPDTTGPGSNLHFPPQAADSGYPRRDIVRDALLTMVSEGHLTPGDRLPPHPGAHRPQ